MPIRAIARSARRERTRSLNKGVVARRMPEGDLLRAEVLLELVPSKKDPEHWLQLTIS